MSSFEDKFTLTMQEKLEIKEYIMLNEQFTNAEISQYFSEMLSKRVDRHAVRRLRNKDYDSIYFASMNDQNIARKSLIPKPSTDGNHETPLQKKSNVKSQNNTNKLQNNKQKDSITQVENVTYMQPAKTASITPDTSVDPQPQPQQQAQHNEVQHNEVQYNKAQHFIQEPQLGDKRSQNQLNGYSYDNKKLDNDPNKEYMYLNNLELGQAIQITDALAGFASNLEDFPQQSQLKQLYLQAKIILEALFEKEKQDVINEIERLKRQQVDATDHFYHDSQENVGFMQSYTEIPHTIQEDITQQQNATYQQNEQQQNNQQNLIQQQVGEQMDIQQIPEFQQKEQQQDVQQNFIQKPQMQIQLEVAQPLNVTKV